MSNSFYNHSTYPTPNAPGSSANMRAELDLITAGFNKLPTLSGNGYKVAMINAAGTALIASSALQQLALTQSTIDSTPIGGTTRAAGAFTTLSANSTVNLGSAVTIAGGVINNTIIGGTTPTAGYFTTIEAGTMDVDSLIAGSFEGPLTGNVTGNVTGNLTGNVTASSGTSSFNNVTINGTLDMNAGTVGTITGLATPTNSSDAAPKGYVDTQVATRLALAGGTMSGAIAMGTNRITGLGDPSSTQDAATKNYTDTQDALKLSLTGGTMSGNLAMGTNRITGVGDPVGNQDAATKAYVDSVAQGLDVKASVRAATTDNITLSGTATVDSVALSAGDRVLVKNQTTASQNGIYVVSAGGWGRAPDMDAWAELPGAFVFVEDGSVNDNSGWVCTVAPGGTIGTTAVTFEQFSGAGQITAGAGMTKSGNTLNVGTASTARIVVNADNIDLALSGVTGGTYRSVTVDNYGRVTGGTNPTTLAGYGITDAYTTTQVDTALALKLNLSGGTMSGNIAMGSNRITGLPTPSASGEAATKGYADDGLALKLNLAGGTMSGAIAMGGSKITGLGEPTLSQDAVTLNYVTTLYGSTASAAASASAAATSATNAATSATNASNSASAAASSATAAAASFDSFDDRYLGPKSSDPTVDNDGNALLTGALYWNTSLNQMKAYSGSAWLLSYVPSDFYLPLSGGTMTGNITLNAGTANGVAYLNGSKVLTTGSALTFDGTNLGVGTSSPSRLFTVNGGASDTVIGMRTNASGPLATDGFDIQYTTSNNVYFTNRESGLFSFESGGSERMRISSAGDVGIGTSSPSYRLDVSGDIRAKINSGGDGTGVLLTNSGSTNGRIDFLTSDSTGRYRLDGLGDTRFAISTFVGGVWGEALSIGRVTQNVGIGTSSPGARLHTVSSGLGDGGGLRIQNTGSGGATFSIWPTATINGEGAGKLIITGPGGNAVTLDSSNNLGIGTSSPSTILYAKASGSYGTITIDNSSTTGGGSFAARQNGSTKAIFGVSGAIEGNTSGDAGMFAETGGGLRFYVNGSGTPSARLDSAGNLGLGFTPNAWGGGYTAIQIAGSGRAFAATGAGAGDLTLAFNAYYDSADNRWEYVYTGDPATRYSTSAGQHRWFTAPSGTAGNAISFTQAMTLDASGRLGVGVTAPSTGVQIRGTTTSDLSVLRITNSTGGLSNADIDLRLENDGAAQLRMYGAYPIQFFTSNLERARINSTGVLSVNSTASVGQFNGRVIAGDNGSIGSFSAPGANTVDTGITVNQGSGGGTMLFLASVNTSDGTNTRSAVYLLQFYFNGNNMPAVTFIAGNSNFVTFGMSGSNTLTVAGVPGNAFYSWFGNK